jgi:hypothetical protein
MRDCGSIEIEGETYRLQFTWQVIDQLRSDWGENFDDRMSAAINTPVLVDLAFLIASASSLSAEDVLDRSPPVDLARAAVADAWARAWFGGEEIKAEEEKESPKLMSVLTTLWRWIWRPFWKLVRLAGRSSGS